MKTILLLVRHGQTTWNVKHKLDGQEDTQLTKEGVIQAQKRSTVIKSYSIDQIICSSLSRSKKTAKIISTETNAPIKEISELREINCGDCTGLTKEEIKLQFPELVAEWDKDTDPRFPNGENMQDVEQRVMPIFEELLKQFKGKTIVVVGHGTVNLAFIGKMLQIPYALRFKIQQSNCCINEIHFSEDNFNIKSINRIV